MIGNIYGSIADFHYIIGHKECNMYLNYILCYKSLFIVLTARELHALVLFIIIRITIKQTIRVKIMIGPDKPSGEVD